MFRGFLIFLKNSKIILERICLKDLKSFKDFPKISLKEYGWNFFKFLEKFMKNKFKRCKTNKI